MVFSDFQFREEKHLQQYLNLLDQYPALIEEVLSFLKQQLQKKIVLPKPAMQSPIEYLCSMLPPIV
jgi:uncharacterized protein (DUF885 family)